MARNEKKAIFAGYFNPFHLGHAYAIKKSMELVSKILIYVTDPKQGTTDIVAPISKRVDLIERWIERNKDLRGFVEVYHGTKTNAELHKAGYEVMICGAEILNYSLKYDWKPFELAQEFIVFLRMPRIYLRGDAVSYYTVARSNVVHILPSEKNNISARELRKRISYGEGGIRDWVPSGFETEIKQWYN